MPALLLAAAIGAVYLTVGPATSDLAAQTYRAELFDRSGFLLWDNGWYGGHHLPGYSVVFPPLGGWIGVRVVGVLALIAAAIGIHRLVRDRAYGSAAATWFTVALGAAAISGRIPFVVGTAFAVWAAVAATSGRRLPAAALGIATGASSPVAALFLALVAATAWWDGSRLPWRRRREVSNPGAIASSSEPLFGDVTPDPAEFDDELVITSGSAVALKSRPATGVMLLEALSSSRGTRRGASATPIPVAGRTDHSPRARDAWLAAGLGAATMMTLLVIAFPEGGSEPFHPSSFWPALAATALAFALAPKGPLRVGVVLYALLLIAAFAIPTPLGGNATRLGALLSGPLALLVLLPARRTLLIAVLLPLLWWTLYPATRDWIEAGGDPATKASFYAPLLTELAHRTGPGDRIEIPLTARHWESAYVAERIPIARGWERQLDRKVNAVFYKGKLTPERYHRWLLNTAVRYVALPDAALDPSAETEARIIGSRPPFLRELQPVGRWRLFAVRDARPTGVRWISADRFATTGDRVVRIRYTAYWAVLSGSGCVERAAGGWTRVRSRGAIEIGLHFELARVAGRGPRCVMKDR